MYTSTGWSSGYVGSTVVSQRESPAVHSPRVCVGVPWALFPLTAPKHVI